MARPKKDAPETPDVPVEETPEVPTPEVAGEESEAKKNYRNLIAAYKVQNPVKYAQKEAEFLKKLNSL